MTDRAAYRAFDHPPPSIEDIERIGKEVLGSLPEAFARHLGGVVIRVEEFPDEATEKMMELDSPYDLLGLYHGIPVGQEHSFHAPPERPDMIFLYRMPLLAYWCENDFSLAAIIENTLIHEIGHHFGLSDDDMEHIEFPDASDALDR